MDSRGIFEMVMIFGIMIGCGTVVLDRHQNESSRAQAFAIVAALVGVVCPSPITRSLKRVKDEQEAVEEK